MVPLGRLTLAMHYGDLARDATHSSFDDRGIQQEDSSRYVMSAAGVAASMRVSSWLSLGARIDRVRLRIESHSRTASTIASRVTGPTPTVFETARDGADVRTSLALGLVVHKRDRLDAGVSWHPGTRFKIGYSRLEDFPSLGLSFWNSGENLFRREALKTAAVAFRPRMRLLLSAEVADLGRAVALAHAAVCVSPLQPTPPRSSLPPEYCPPFAPSDEWVGSAGYVLRLGAERAYSAGKRPVFLRAGFVAGEYGPAATLGAGIVLRQALHVDVGARLGNGLKEGRFSLSARF